VSVSDLFGKSAPPSNGTQDSLETMSSGSESKAEIGTTQSLYRKYRPQTFRADELVGQDPIVRTLKNSIVLNRVAHAYLFAGPRGTGKTTTARILAKAVNCLDPNPENRPCNKCPACNAILRGSTTDIIEIDAASNRGIDDIRELRERVKFAPTFLRTKFYIVDEAHQITGAAANAFLKTLEEPPSHTKFLLATTDPEQLLPTIVSRCQRFDFRRISQDQIVGRLALVASAEGIEVDRAALEIISDHSSGSLRDALGLLDQLAVFGNRDESHDKACITEDEVNRFLGISKNERVELLVEALAERDAGRALSLLGEAIDAGEDPRQLNRQLTSYLRTLMYLLAGDRSPIDSRAADLSRRFSLLEVAQLSRRFSEADFKIRHASLPHLPLEISLVEAILRPTAAEFESPSSRMQSAAEAPASHAVWVTDNRKTIREQPKPTREERQADPQSEKTSTAQDIVLVAGEALSIERLHDLWPKIRMDVKARDRRIEALLSSCDPGTVRGDEVTLVTNYKFHSEKINEDYARSMIEDVIARLVDHNVNIICQLRGSATTATSAGQSPVSNNENANDPETQEPKMTAEDRPDEDRRVTAAKNIFDAEEVKS
jgi:DNA polymerase III subunit gamma/tau